MTTSSIRATGKVPTETTPSRQPVKTTKTAAIRTTLLTEEGKPQLPKAAHCQAQRVAKTRRIALLTAKPAVNKRTPGRY